MPSKPGGAGKPEAYDPKTGRYVKSTESRFPNGANPETWANLKASSAKQATQYLAKFFPMYTEYINGADDNPVYRWNDSEAKRIADSFRRNVDPNDPENLRVRIPASSTVLRKIAADGKLKSQHESGSSHGLYDPELRSIHERLMFDTDSAQPIYGYVKPTKIEAGDSLQRTGVANFVSAYGDAALVLKPEVKSRTTVTHGDSLMTDVGGAPAPVPLNDVHTASDKRLAAGTTERTASYIEAQIHGGVTTNDIAKILVHEDQWLSDRSPDDVARRRAVLEAVFPGVPVEVIPKTEAYYDFALPASVGISLR